MAWSLCTRDDVMSIFKIDEASLHDFWSETAESMIRGYLRAPYLGLAPVTISEYHSGDGTGVLPVNSPPLTEVLELLVDGVALAAGDYQAFSTSVILTGSAVFPEGLMNIKVTYKSGGTGIPDKVSMTCATMIAAIASYEGRAGTDASLKYGDLTPYIGGDATNKNIGLVTHLQTIMQGMLSRYRLRVR